MDKPILTPFSLLAQPFIQEYERYLPIAFDESMTLLQKVNKIIKFLEEVGEWSNEVILKWSDLISWLSQQGLFDTGITDARQFGAIGDGVTDDTLALQNWIASTKKNLVLREGVYILKDSLISNLAGRTITCEGATIRYDGNSDGEVFIINGNDTAISVNIDGNGKACHGVVVNGDGCLVSNCEIENLYGLNLNCLAIACFSPNGVVIENNRIGNLDAYSNNQTGDSIGAVRAIYLYSTVAATKLNVIRNNTIDTVLGEEGDAIHIQYGAGTTFPYLESRCVIQGNVIKDANRRGIKLQASGVKVIGNTYVNTLSQSQCPNANSVINVIYGKDIVIADNDIDAGIMIGVSLSGGDNNGALGTPYYPTKISVKNNRIKGGLLTGAGGQQDTHGIYFTYIKDSEIKGNTVYDGLVGITGTFSSNLSITDNVLYGGNDVVTQVAIKLFSSNSGLIVKDNVGASGNRLYFIHNESPYAVIEGNHSRMNAGHIRTFITAKGSIYKHNTSNSDALTVIGDFTDQFISEHRNAGNGASGVGVAGIVFADSIPSLTNFPTMHFTNGDICYNTNPSGGGKAGWICVVAGTPGTWKAFGSIDA